MKILVIGGCGFIGSHIVDRLVSHGISVRAFDRRPEAFRDPLPDVEFVMGDLADSAQIFEAMTGIDAVVHLASTSVPATSNLDPVADITGNLISTVRLLQVMRAVGVRKLIYLSSGGTVYGVPETDPVAETHPLRAISSYGIVKIAIENYLFMEHKLHGLQHIILRASNPYGPRQGHIGIQGIIGTYLWRCARQENIEIWGDGSVVRDYIHVRDLAEVCVRAVKSDAVGCFNAGSGNGVAVSDIVQHIKDIVKSTTDREVVAVYKPGRSFDVPRVVLDISKLKREFGWAPDISLHDGIAESWQWVRSRL